MQIRASYGYFQKQENKLQLSPPGVSLQGAEIEGVEYFKYLGIIIAADPFKYSLYFAKVQKRAISAHCVASGLI